MKENKGRTQEKKHEMVRKIKLDKDKEFRKTGWQDQFGATPWLPKRFRK